MSKFRIAAIGAIAAVLLGLGLAAPAMASPAGGPQATIGGNPTGSPTCTPDGQPTTDAPTGAPTNDLGIPPCTPPPKCPLLGRDGTPLPLPVGKVDLTGCKFRIAQEDFGFTDTNLVRDGLVTATGPVRFSPFVFGLQGRDFTLSPTLDLLRALFGSVLVHSQPLAGTVDLGTCSIKVDQSDLPWFIRGGGTGIYRNIIGAGLYSVDGIVSFPTRYFRCTLPVGLTDAQASDALNDNFSTLPVQPIDWGLSVNATGWAATVPHLQRCDVQVWNSQCDGGNPNPNPVIYTDAWQTWYHG